MALPTPVKTWQVDPNNAVTYITSASATAQRLMLGIKNALIGFGTLPWTVSGSSNSVAAGMDAVDRWTLSTNLVWTFLGSGAARSWIVLRQTGIGATFEICIHLLRSSTDSNNFLYVEMVASQVGFSGGSTTARPTAADEVIFNDLAGSAPGTGGLWGSSSTASVGYHYHVMQSTDGQCTRVVINQDNDGDCSGFMLFDKPKNPVTGWSDPYVVLGIGNSTGSVMTHAVVNDLAKAYGRGSGTMSMYLTCEGTVSSMITEQQTVVNAFDASWPMAPMGLYSATASHIGRHGELFDIWYGSTTRVNGDQYPDSGTTYQFTQFDDIILPWDSTNPVTVI